MKIKIRHWIYLLFFTIISMNVFAEESIIEVVDKTVKISALEEVSFYYAFAEGDEVIFTFSEGNGKPVKEIEVRRDGGNIRYSEFKTSTVDGKVIKIHKSGVFQFRFYNGAISGRVCSIHIQRKPASENTISFNTGWEWKNVFDTTYYLVNEDSLIGYDTIYEPYSVKEVLRTDTSFYEFTKSERIHTLLNSSGDRSVVSFDLPPQYQKKYEERTLIGWAYWFGSEGPPEIGNTLKVASLTAKISPIAGLALGLWSINKSVGGRNVNYGVLGDYENAMMYLRKDSNAKGSDWGDGSSSSMQITDWYPQTFYIGFDNDHTYPVDVDIIVSVVMELTEYHDVAYEKEIVSPVTVVLEKKKMKISESKIRTIID